MGRVFVTDESKPPAGTYQEPCILIGNYRIEADKDTGESHEFATGLDQQQFYSCMQAFAKAHQGIVVDYLPDAVVLPRTPEISDIVAREDFAFATGSAPHWGADMVVQYMGNRQAPRCNA